MADQLYGPLPGSDPAPPPSTAGLMRVEQDLGNGEHFVLHMPLPLAVRADVDAVRAGDDLVVSVGPYRRVLTLPSVLRRCIVTGGEFDGRELRVRFRPDPARWPARPRPRPGPGRRARRAHEGGGGG
jgi:arsenite-transporting ATPase